MITHADNFSLYGRNKNIMTNNIYASTESGAIDLVNDPDGISAGTVLRQQSNLNNNSVPWRYASPFGQNLTLGVAFRLWLTGLPNTNNGYVKYISIRNAENQFLLELTVNSTGTVTLTPQVGSYTTPTPVISANGWYHFELKFYNNTTTGNSTSFELRIEGVTVIKQDNLLISTGTNNIPAQIATSRANFNSQVDPPCYYKDLVTWDGAGTSNNDFLGSVLVINLDPVGDVQLNWTPSTGATGVGILGARPPVDTNYIQAATPPPAPFRCSLGQLPANVSSVRALISYVRAQKSDGGDGNLQNALVSGATAGLGANRPITVTPTYWRDFFSQDPATNAPWTPAAVNQARLQINRTA